MTGMMLPVALQREYVSPDTTLTFGSAHVFAHGFGVAPKAVIMELVCQTADVGFSPGTVIFVGPGETNGYGLTVVRDATNVAVNVHAGGLIMVRPGSPYDSVVLTAANWKIRVRAFR